MQGGVRLARVSVAACSLRRVHGSFLFVVEVKGKVAQKELEGKVSRLSVLRSEASRVIE